LSAKVVFLIHSINIFVGQTPFYNEKVPP